MLHKALTILLDIAAVLFTVVAFLEKHHSFFASVAAILAIIYWCWQFLKSAIHSKPASVKRNLDPRHNPVSSYLGALLIVVSLGMFIVPLFYTVKEQLHYTIPTGIGIIGLGLLLIPDDFKRAFKRFLNTKASGSYRDNLNNGGAE